MCEVAVCMNEIIHCDSHKVCYSVAGGLLLRNSEVIHWVYVLLFGKFVGRVEAVMGFSLEHALSTE
jgi:hypothetical protein